MIVGALMRLAAQGGFRVQGMPCTYDWGAYDWGARPSIG
jgi:hypothetical protein